MKVDDKVTWVDGKDVERSGLVVAIIPPNEGVLTGDVKDQVKTAQDGKFDVFAHNTFAFFEGQFRMDRFGSGWPMDEESYLVVLPDGESKPLLMRALSSQLKP